MAQAPKVLQEGGLIAAIGTLVKLEIPRQAGVENRDAVELVGDDSIRKVLVDGGEQGVGARFEFVRSQAGRDAPSEVTFAKAAVLARQDGGREGVGPKLGRGVANH